MNIEKPKLAVLTVTPNAKAQALRLANVLPCDCYTSDKLVSEGFIGFDGSMSECVKRLFAEYEALLFICATGITVRMIAPLVVDKLADPAVLVMDEKAEHVISLLSGHVGGGNQYAHRIADLLGGKAIITTATDVNQVAALDILIKQVGADCVDYRQEIKQVNQKLVSGNKVGLYLDQVTVSDTRGFVLINDLTKVPQELDMLVIVSSKTNITLNVSCPVTQVIPKNIVVGMGCKRDTDGELIYQTLCQHLVKHHINIKAIGKIGSVVIKQNEIGLIQLAKRLSVPFEIFQIEELKAHEHRFEGSEFVKKTIGVGCVSQPSAWIMSRGCLLGDTLKQDGITITLGVNQCCI